MRRGNHLVKINFKKIIKFIYFQLYHDRFANRLELLTAYVSSIFVSNCGNFALIGYSSGHVDVFNMQSGKYKFSLENRWTAADGEAKQQRKKVILYYICFNLI